MTWWSFPLGVWGPLLEAKFYSNHMSYVDLDGMEWKKCKNLWGQVENFRDDMGSNQFMFLLLGLYYNNFQGHSSAYYTTWLDFNMYIKRVVEIAKNRGLRDHFVGVEWPSKELWVIFLFVAFHCTILMSIRLGFSSSSFFY